MNSHNGFFPLRIDEGVLERAPSRVIRHFYFRHPRGRSETASFVAPSLSIPCIASTPTETHARLLAHPLLLAFSHAVIFCCTAKNLLLLKWFLPRDQTLCVRHHASAAHTNLFFYSFSILFPFLSYMSHVFYAKKRSSTNIENPTELA